MTDTTDFDALIQNWDNLGSEGIGDSFYFPRKTDNNSLKRNSKSSTWFRSVLYSLDQKDLERFKISLANETLELRFYLGIKKIGNGNFFSPFISFVNKTNNCSTSDYDIENSFELIVHIQNTDEKPEENKETRLLNYYQFNESSSKENLSSSSIPKKLATQLIRNWQLSLPSQIGNEFSAVVTSKQQNIGYTKEIERVIFYKYNAHENFTKNYNSEKEKKKRIASITSVSFAMGINANLLTTNLPCYSPVLIYQLKQFNNDSESNGVKGPEINGEEYYEDLANPCPPTC